jgi:transposase-like protein
MPWLAADPVIVLPAQGEALEALVRAHSTSQQLAVRARMILHAADNIGVRESARELDVWPKTVRYWRKRWREAPDAQSVPERLCDAFGRAGDIHPRADLRVDRDDLREAVGERAADQPLEPARDCRTVITASPLRWRLGWKRQAGEPLNRGCATKCPMTCGKQRSERAASRSRSFRRRNPCEHVSCYRARVPGQSP